MNVVNACQPANWHYIEGMGGVMQDSGRFGETTIVLPRSGGLASIDPLLTAANLAEWSSEASTADVVLSVPKFTMETQANLFNVLSQMGMSDAFNSHLDAFPDIGSEPLNINLAVHKAFVRVDENGTEAAAATGILTVSATVYVPPPPRVVFNANHPFYVSINDTKTGATLFSGAVVQPSN